ncbi:hypothetical protein CsSME_00047147 [Camellia sinensis var. sinensis]
MLGLLISLDWVDWSIVDAYLNQKYKGARTVMLTGVRNFTSSTVAGTPREDVKCEINTRYSISGGAVVRIDWVYNP